MNLNLSKIIDLINTDNFAKAEIEIRKIYNDNPRDFKINKLLGHSLLAQRKYNLALKCFERCYEKNENDYDTLLNLSYLFTKIQFYEQSISFCEKAINLNNKHPGAYQNLAISYFHLNRYEEAELNSLKSIELCGGLESKNFYEVATELVGIHGDILLAQKKNDQFINYAKKILELTYDQSVLIKLLRLDRKHITEKYLKNIDDVLIKSNDLIRKIDRNTYSSGAHFFLAEYFNKIDQQKSEEHYVVGNQLIADMQRESLFIRQKTVRAVCNYFKDHGVKDTIKDIDPKKGEGLIFVLGMPRSGTTLTESVLGAADDIVAGGEKSFFSLQLHQTAKNLGSPEIILDEEFFEDLGNRYIDHIKLHRNGKKYFIDKLPENYFFYKFIKLALPSAKFIHCYRDPWDNAISLFKQNYSISVFFASSFFGIALEYANYEHLMKFWKEQDGPDAFLDVKYEDLVQNDTNYINKLWEYCGLQGGYSEEKRQKHFGYTASFQQVTKEIYKSSVKKADFSKFHQIFMSDLENQREYWKKLQ